MFSICLGETHWRHSTCPYQRFPRPIENVDQGALYYRKYFSGQGKFIYKCVKYVCQRIVSSLLKLMIQYKTFLRFVLLCGIGKVIVLTFTNYFLSDLCCLLPH